MSEYRLCYVANGILYFTDNFEKQWGDDWNDAPYEHNAGAPYEIDEDYAGESYGHIKRVGFERVEYDVMLPCDGRLNSPYSVQDINGGAVAWLYNASKHTALHAGATIDEAIKWLRENGCRAGELK